MNQWLVETDIVVDAAGIESSLEFEKSFSGRCGEVKQGGLMYSFPGKQEIRVCNGTKRGSWKQVIDRKSDKILEKKVFDLQIDHGVNPQDADYAYIVVDENMGSKDGDWPMIVSNTADVQAVRFGGKLMMVFYRASEIAFESGAKIRPDKPCIVMLDSGWLSLAEPTRKLTDVTVLVIDKNGGRQTIKFDLPQDGMAGSTVKKQVSGV